MIALLAGDHKRFKLLARVLTVLDLLRHAVVIRRQY